MIFFVCDFVFLVYLNIKQDRFFVFKMFSTDKDYKMVPVIGCVNPGTSLKIDIRAPEMVDKSSKRPKFKMSYIDSANEVLSDDISHEVIFNNLVIL